MSGGGRGVDWDADWGGPWEGLDPAPLVRIILRWDGREVALIQAYGVDATPRLVRVFWPGHPRPTAWMDLDRARRWWRAHAGAGWPWPAWLTEWEIIG